MRKIISILGLLAMCSCAGMQYELVGRQNVHPEDIEVSQVEGSGGKIRIEYENHDSVKEIMEKKISNEMIDEKESAVLRKTIPLGGRFVIHIMRPTVETGNTKWFTYVIKKNGKEISRTKGADGPGSVPEVPHRFGVDGSYWNNIEIVNIEQSFSKDDVLELFVIDSISNSRDEFKISHKKATVSSN